MKISIHSNVEIDKSFEEYLNKKVENLGKFIFDEGNAEIFIKKEGPFYVAEIDIHTKNHIIFLKEKENDLAKCVDLLIDRTKRKLRQLHDRIVDKNRK